MRKHVVIINGRGGVGKDTLVAAAARDVGHTVINTSSIDTIKYVASHYFGWTGSKTDKDRKFLADLKQLVYGYGDTLYKNLYFNVLHMLETNDDRSKISKIVFVHIREPQEIDRMKVDLKEYAANNKDVHIHTLLIRNPDDSVKYGNSADDDVAKYKYDLVYNNTLTEEMAVIDFPAWLFRTLDK